MGYRNCFSSRGGKNMENIYYYQQIPTQELENLYASLFIKQYKYLFLPKICVLFKEQILSESAQSYVISLNRGLFDHCIYLNRLDILDKEIISIIHDIYIQFKIFGFDHEEANTRLRNIGRLNSDYSEFLLEHFEEIKDEGTFLNLVPFFDSENENLLLTEVERRFIHH